MGAAIITKDEDFAIHLLLHGGPAVVWLRLGNTRRAALLSRVEADLGRIVTALRSGETLIEVA
jgi:predicted nuclease of predicted toxin-antitoxin system